MKGMKLTNIINVTDQIRPTEEQYKIFDVFYLPLQDNETYDILTAIQTTAFYINSLIANNNNNNNTKARKILVHCSAGISRSSSIIIGYCMIYKKMNLLDAYDFVKSKKANIAPNPGFMAQLIKLEQEIFELNEPTLNYKDYVVSLLKQIFPSMKDEDIAETLDRCQGDYNAAQNALFSIAYTQ